jgi:hypothetical protein
LILVAMALVAALGHELGPRSVAARAMGTAIEDAALRAAPEDEAPVLLWIARDVRLEIGGRAERGYYPVQFRGLAGWMATGAIATNSDESGTPGDPGTLIADAQIDLRAEADALSAVIDEVAVGAELEPTGVHANGFVQIAYEDLTGWALGESLRVIAGGGPRDPDDYTEEELIEIIHDAADYYGQSRRAMLRVAQCESQLDPEAVNPETGDSGLFQFNPNTWLTTPYGEYDIFDPRASAYAAGWMWSVGRRGEWVCQ